MAPGSVAHREAALAADGPDEATAHAQNLDVLNSRLGRGGFQRANPDARPPFQDSLELKLGSAIAKKGTKPWAARSGTSPRRRSARLS